jgi:DNA-binding PadR family transcriptional regulator
MTDAELVILGLLQQGNRHPYQIEQRIEERRLRQWAAVAFSSLYYLLDRAEKLGWVRSRRAPGRKGPATRDYRLTPRGRRELQQAVEARLQLPFHPAGVELAVMFSGALPTDRFRTALKKLAEECRIAAADARRRWQEMPDSPYRTHADAIFDHSIAHLECEAAWADRTLGRLAAPDPFSRRMP